ncbi:MAG: type I polyketide synthase, partial [Pseudomonadota bacterium]
MTSKKQALRQIYDALSEGRIGRDEALTRIRAIKRGGIADAVDGANDAPLLAMRVWEQARATTIVDPPLVAAHRIALCELPGISAEALSSALPGSVCIALEAQSEDAVHRRFVEHALRCFEETKTLLASRSPGRMLFQIVVSDDGGDDHGDGGETALFAGLSGLLRTAALENPQFVGQLIRVPAGIATDALATLLRRDAGRPEEAEIRYRGDARAVARWQEIESAASPASSAWRDGGVYLITGGLGGLGRLFAQDILRRARGATVVLAGRGAIDARREAALRSLSADDGRARYRPVDLEDAASVDALVASILAEHGRLDGVLHSAGMIADNFLLKKDAGEFARVLGPKVLGTWHLDAATRAVPLEIFALFSSIASAFGNVGQADYAAGNAFMDAFASHRNALVAAGHRRGRTLAIDWSLWREGGMTLDAETLDRIVRDTGMRPMRTSTGLEAFHRSVATTADRTIAMAGDPERMRALLAEGAFPRGESPARVPVEAPAPLAAPADVGDVADLAGKTEDWLRRELAGLLKLPADRIDPQAGLERYGIDSILAMQLTNRLEQTFGSLSKTLFFEYQTLRELAVFFAERHVPKLLTLFAATRPAETARAASPPVQRTSAPVPKSRTGFRGRIRTAEPSPIPQRSQERSDARRAEPIAIVGLSGRYPEAIDIAAFWRNLRDGRDCIVEVPEARWDWRRWYSEDRTGSGRHFSKWGGFIAGVDEFDPLFFNISPKEAKLIDPQERLFLQHAWMAIEDAGYTREGLQFAERDDQPGQVGVYAGLMYTEYQLLGAEASLQGTPLGVPVSAASIANRVSYALNLHGPSMTVDTMCSSSLTAIHLACQDLHGGRIRMALAGGVNVSIHPNKYLVLSAGQFISSDGHCQSFGEGGDGYIPGEGVGVVVLKRLSDAERDGD